MFIAGLWPDELRELVKQDFRDFRQPAFAKILTKAREYWNERIHYLQHGVLFKQDGPRRPRDNTDWHMFPSSGNGGFGAYFIHKPRVEVSVTTFPKERAAATDKVQTAGSVPHYEAVFEMRPQAH